MSVSSQAFITEVKSQENNKKLKKSVLSLSVRKDYAKLQDVVQHFAKKVDILVDKQRHEYLQAYEHHMSDVQRELYNLREKATAIANDTTREEKIKKLDSDQKWFRNEAMRLDIETNEFRKKMRDIKVTIQSTERERDWLLDKLRAAKEKYKKLKTVRNDLFEKYGGTGTLDGGFSVGSNDSSYTLELQQIRSVNQLNGIRANKTSDWREQLQRDYLVTREVSEKEKEKKDTLKLKKGKKNSVQLAPIESVDFSGSKQLQLPMVKNIRHEKEEQERERKELVSRLVTERAKQDGVRDFIGQCYNCASVGSWRKFRSRDLQDILQDCQDVIRELSSEPNEDQMNNLYKRKEELVQELVNYPEVYDSITMIISSQSQTIDDREFRSNNNEGVDKDEGEINGGRESARGSARENHGNDELSLADDVRKYFNEEKMKREEYELNERSRRLFGGN
mmetsp:Transcript_9006/g.9525  ORF Transcript_9006/g.9525 Transcript_9006/m.9525 type:complete len:450 (+) Transcript_9006:81-1430(+)